jgi:hypothetical protein
MNWEIVGSIGELFGAVAVVVSLVYLAKQINQNTKQVEKQSRTQRLSVLGHLGDQWRGFRSNITSNPEVATIWRRGNENLEQLDADERTLFDLLLVEFFWGITYNWMMGVEEGLGEYLRDEIEDNLLIYYSPGLRAWWESSPHRNEYPSDLIATVDGLFKKNS